MSRYLASLTLLCLFAAGIQAAPNRIVTVQTVLGTFELELLEDDAPGTVANFLNYVNDGDFDGTFIHRSVPGFIIQGGGYRYNSDTNTAPSIDRDPPIANEYGVSNTRGTVAMAKTAVSSDTATSEWFVNLADNSGNLDNQNGGFTVFALVINDGMAVVDSIAALPITRLDNGTFTDTPLIDFDGVTLTDDNFVIVQQMSASFDTDGDRIPDSRDPDDDNDGTLDTADAFPFDSTETLDTDEDGTGNNADDDDDGDGVLDTDDAFPLDAGRLMARLDAPAIIELLVLGQELVSSVGVVAVPAEATAVALNVTAVDPSSAGFITAWPCGVDRPLASNLNYVQGAVVPNGVIASVGGQGSVCFYSQSNTDLIVDIAGWFEGTAYAGATPTRLVDTRDGTGGVSVPVNPDNVLTIQVSDLQVLDALGVSTTIPATTGAVALNVTVVGPDSAGFVTVWPCDVTRPVSSNVNYSQSQVVANGVISSLSAAGTVCLYSQASTDIVVDLAGWFPGQSFTGTTPKRLVDTRDGTGGNNDSITLDGLAVPVHGITLNLGDSSQEVPVTATAAALNVTVVNPDSAGFVTVWPCSVSRPLASNLNFTASNVVANNVIAPIGNDGSVCVYSNVPTDVIVDIAGWFNSDPSGEFVGTTPERLVDTRDGTGPGPE